MTADDTVSDKAVSNDTVSNDTVSNDTVSNDTVSNDTVTPEQLVAAIDGPLNALGSSFYFVPPTLARGKELGLDGFRFYFLGRGGVLGDVEAPVIASAFGYFHPDLVARMWDSARQKLAPRQAGQIYLECCREHGREHLADVEGLAPFCAAAEAVVAAVNPAGLALFAGIAAEELPKDLPGRAMQLVAVLRELRGSVHLVAVVATGLSPGVAHAVKRPGDVKSFGWSDADSEVTESDRLGLATAVALTDRMMAAHYAALSGGDAVGLREGVRRIEAALAG